MKRLGFVYSLAALTAVLSLSAGPLTLSAETPEPASDGAWTSLFEGPEQTSDCIKSCGVDPNG